tara:strand:- start:4090 stop:4365 length:276 start_codon:yes stop_codon:yes gene_type:complete
MSLSKRDIATNISTKAHISVVDSNNILNKLLELLITKSKIKSVKISNFGTFYQHITPKRVGRNPLTKEEYIINPRSKLSLKTSNYIKKLIN